MTRINTSRMRRSAASAACAAVMATSLSSCVLMGGVNGGAVGAAAKKAKDAEANDSCSISGGGKYTPIKSDQRATVRSMIGVAKHLGIGRDGQIIATMVMLQESGIHTYANDGTNPRGSGDPNWPAPGRAFWLKTAALSMKMPHDLVGNDADSVGHFQQRASMAWADDASFKAKDHPEEAIQRLMSIEWESWSFFGGSGGSPNRGLRDVSGWQNLEQSVAAQRVQGSAFPSAYQKWSSQAAQLVDANQDAPAIDPAEGTSGATTPPSSSPSPTLPGQDTMTSASSSAASSTSSAAAAAASSGCGGSTAGDPGLAKGAAKDVIDAAKKWVGTPYSWGGGTFEGPGFGYSGDGVQPNANTTKGFDCSGLVRYAVYQGSKKSLKLPRTSAQQYAATSANRVAYKDLQPGDLMFWSRGGAGSIYHVAVYMGGGMMIESPLPGGHTQIVKARPSQFFAGTRLKYEK